MDGQPKPEIPEPELREYEGVLKQMLQFNVRQRQQEQQFTSLKSARDALLLKIVQKHGMTEGDTGWKGETSSGKPKVAPPDVVSPIVEGEGEPTWPEVRLAYPAMSHQGMSECASSGRNRSPRGTGMREQTNPWSRKSKAESRRTKTSSKVTKRWRRQSSA